MLHSHISKTRPGLRPQTLDHLIVALGEEAMHQSAEDALRTMAGSVWKILVDTAAIPVPSGRLESRSSVLRRRRAVRILADSGLLRRHWHRLEFLIDDPDHELAAEMCLIALQVAPLTVRRKALHRLLEALPSLNWFIKVEAEDTLCECFTALGDDLQNEMERRKRMPTPELDLVLRLLQSVERRAADQQDAACLRGSVRHATARIGVLRRLRLWGSALFSPREERDAGEPRNRVTTSCASRRESSVAQSGDSLLR